MKLLYLARIALIDTAYDIAMEIVNRLEDMKRKAYRVWKEAA